MCRRLFVILPSKGEHCYYTFLQMVLQVAVRERRLDLSLPGSISWRAVMCDFEMGIHNAFVDVAAN